jgi:hypothetical protein
VFGLCWPLLWDDGTVWGLEEGHGGRLCCGSGGSCGGELDGLVVEVEVEVLGKWRMRMVV